MRKQTPPPPHSTRSYIVTGIIFTVIAFGFWFHLNRQNIQEFTETYKNREEAQLAITQTKQRIAQLKRQQQSLAYNGFETEKQIRERLQLHRPGEHVVFFTKEQTTATTTTGHSATATTATRQDGE